MSEHYVIIFHSLRDFSNIFVSLCDSRTSHSVPKNTYTAFRLWCNDQKIKFNHFDRCADVFDERTGKVHKSFVGIINENHLKSMATTLYMNMASNTARICMSTGS